MIAREEFPRPAPLTERVRAWALHEVDAWIDAQEVATTKVVVELQRLRSRTLGEMCVDVLASRESGPQGSEAELESEGSLEEPDEDEC